MSSRSAADEAGSSGSSGPDVPIAEMTQSDRKVAVLRNYYETLRLIWSLEDAAAQAALLAGASEGEIEAVCDQAEHDEAEGNDERPEPGQERT